MKLSKLSPAEFETMLILWGSPEPIRPVALLEQVNRTHTWSISTLQTILSRLEDKGMISITSEKRFRYCSPKISKEEYAVMETGSLIERLCDYSPVSLMSGLINIGRVTEAELEEIDALLKAEREKHSRESESSATDTVGSETCNADTKKGESV